MAGKIRKAWLYLKSLGPILLSHHPSCDKFENHSIKAGKYRLCIGCFIGYPAVILSIIMLGIFRIDAYFSPDILFLIGLILISSFFLGLFGLTEKKLLKIIQKIIIGIGAGFIFWGIWSLPNSFLINFLFFIMVYGAGLTVLNAQHAYGIIKGCKHCTYYKKWEECPGFRDVYLRFEQNDLEFPFRDRERERKENI